MATARKPARKTRKASEATRTEKKPVLDYDALIKPGSFLERRGGMVPTVSLGRFASVGVLPPELMKNAAGRRKKVTDSVKAEKKVLPDYDALIKPGSFLARRGGMVPTVSLGRYASQGIIEDEETD